MNDTLLKVSDLSVEFRNGSTVNKAVSGVSWDIRRGETLAILGESGSGKSVSASAIMGLIDSPPGRITSGRAEFDGMDLLHLDDAERRRINGPRIAMIFQDPLAHLNPVYPIGWQVAESMRLHGVSPEEARRHTLELLERVGIRNAKARLKDYPHQFSGGQRQRIMIAMAIALKPDLLIADEPTTALDVTVQAQILDLLTELRRETGMAVLLITHDLGVVAQTADRVVVMKDGQVVERGDVREVFGAPAHPYTRQLLDAVPGKSRFRQPEAAGERLLEGRGVAKFYPISAGWFGRPVETLKALDGVDFDLHKGETLGIVGESGSGKSTLARTVLGLTRPTSGEIRWRGRNVAQMSAAELFEMRRNLQVVFQDPTASLNPRMSVAEIIAEPWAIHKGFLPRAQWKDRTVELLENVGLRAEHAERHPHQFSGGQRQRIAIARALALQPEVILCDEAVSALDVSVQAQVIDLLRKLQTQYALSYIFIAHDLPLVRDFADRILVMKQGKVVEEGTAQEIFERPREPYTMELIAASPDAVPRSESRWRSAQ
ncbi:ABC transporter ATP-binding protein [Pelagibacterium lacus]|uniref:ABC transporter ATP-binding protein n=1 Tax=Pelagibacterium lacus TaxID=2282655 RepID=A0A369W0W2_9HYPH|nr:ABC transporter ATP-binding protein [Pelagibacterium lacus]RDE07679.1 ABC transporter ATP-binding protein [Pelagibacterium lacus]